MRPLRYAINVTLDGCCDHRSVLPDEELHRYWAETLAGAGALLYGRTTYRMMEEAWRPRPDGDWPEWMAGWMVPFAETISGARKHVVHPVVAGHGPYLLAGLTAGVGLEPAGRRELASGAVALRFRVRSGA